MRACVRACVRECVRACVCTRMSIYLCMYMSESSDYSTNTKELPTPMVVLHHMYAIANLRLLVFSVHRVNKQSNYSVASRFNIMVTVRKLVQLN